MLRSVKLFETVALFSRRAVIDASYQRQFGEILKCSFTTRATESTVDRAQMRARTENANLKDILVRIQKQKLTGQDAFRILKICGTEGTLHTELVDDIWAVLKSNAILDATHYNMLLKFYVENEKSFEPVEFLEQMLQAGVEPNRATYNYLSQAFAIRGDVDGVVNIFEELNRRGIPINEITYNSLILALANIGDVEKMREIENVMTQKGLTVQPNTLNALLHGYAKTGRIDDLNQTFDRFKELKTVLLNKDVLNVILELYASGHHELIEAIAQRLYKTLEFDASLNAFAAKVVQRNLDGIVEKLLSIFDEPKKLELVKAYVTALRYASVEQTTKALKLLEGHGITFQTHPSVFVRALQLNSPQLIWDILYDMKAKSLPIAINHFQKLIELESANGTDAVLDLVRLMKKDFDIDLDMVTIRDVILPSINVAADPLRAFARLRTVESNSFKIARSMFERCLLDNNIRAAYEVLNDFKKFSFNVGSLRHSLIDAFVATGDAQHFAKIVNILQVGFYNFKKLTRVSSEISDEIVPDTDSLTKSDSEEDPRENREAAKATTTPPAQIALIGDLLRESIDRIQQNPDLVESLLQAFSHEGLPISPECAHIISGNFGNALNKHSVALLKKLCSGELSPSYLDMEERRRPTLNLLSSDELGKMIEIEEERGRETTALKKLQFRSYIKEKNVAKVVELAAIVTLTNLDHGDIIQMHFQMGDTIGGWKYLNEMQKVNPSYHLGKSQVILVAQILYAKKCEWTDVIRLFVENKQPNPPEEHMINIHRLLQQVYEGGTVAQLNELCKVMIENNFMVSDGRVAGLLVGVHLKNNDLEGAMRTFEQQYTEKRLTSGKILLMRALIQANEFEKLQIVFDMVLSANSQSVAGLSLARSFIEVGSIRQAHVALKNISSDSDDRLASAFRRNCEYYHKMGWYKLLEGLLEATDGLDYDRDCIYYYLLLHYCEQNNSRMALELWYKQLDEHESPSREFLQTLGSHLKRNNMEVPFLVPNADPKRAQRPAQRNSEPIANQKHVPEPKRRQRASPNESPKKKAPAESIELRDAIARGDADTALSLWQKFDSSNSRFTELSSDLIKLLCKSNRGGEATDIALKSFKSKNSVLRQLTEQLVKDIDFQSLERLEDSLPAAKKRSIRLGTKILKAYEHSGEWNKYFERVLTKAESGTDETIQDMNVSISYFSLLTLLQRGAIPLNEFKEFAEKAAEKRISCPLNVLWAHSFLHDSNDSSELYDRLERDFPTRVYVSFVGRYILNEGNQEKLQQLLEFLRTKSEDQVASVKHVIFTDHVAQNRIQDALAMIDDGTCPVERLPREVLRYLKNRIVANGDHIPESILPKI